MTLMDEKMVQIREVKSIYSILTPNDRCVSLSSRWLQEGGWSSTVLRKSFSTMAGKRQLEERV